MAKILILGASGQLGRELADLLPRFPELTLADTGNTPPDVTSEESLSAALQAHQPDIVINASAYTSVDLAESEQDAADAVNHVAVQKLASRCRAQGVRLLHVSTDFVFDGRQSSPYLPDSPTNPLSAYGRSKLAGEQAIQSTPGLDYLILRTSWLYSSHRTNFVKTMLRLFKEKELLNIVYDQVGSPTWARDLAAVLLKAARTPRLSGLHHYTNAGVASWYDFAVAIQEESAALGLNNNSCKLHPILTTAYPTPASRPHYSVLDCSSLEESLEIDRPHWRYSLRKMLEELQGKCQTSS